MVLSNTSEIEAIDVVLRAEQEISEGKLLRRVSKIIIGVLFVM